MLFHSNAISIDKGLLYTNYLHTTRNGKIEPAWLLLKAVYIDHGFVYKLLSESLFCMYIQKIKDFAIKPEAWELEYD